MWRYAAIVLLASCRAILGIDEPVNGDAGPALPLVAFEFETSGADEQSGTIMVPVVLSEPAAEAITVSYSLLASTAMPGTDFEIQGGSVTIPAGETQASVAVVIRADTDETEASENFSIALSSPVGAWLDETRAIHTVTIADHILPRVTLKQMSSSNSEGLPSQLQIMMDKPSEGPGTIVIGVAFNGVTVPASLNDLSLAEGTVVTIPDGATTVLVPIGEVDDTLDEEDIESVVFTIKGPSVNLVLGATATVTHGISDNDSPPDVRFTVATSTPLETAGSVQVMVTLSAVSGRMVRVDYAVDAASIATVPSDATVTGAPGMLTFLPGETSKQITTTINNDNIDEVDEALLLQLSNPLNAIITTMTHTMTISDNDTASVSFQTAASTVDEDNANTVNLTVVMSTTSSRIVTVPFGLNGGTATLNDDFVIVTSSPLTFAPGDTSKTIAVQVINNNPNTEPDETALIDLGTPTNALLATPTRHTLTIQE